MANRKKDKVGGVVLGPLLVLGALAALWQNEARFDYAEAARRTSPVTAPAEAADGENISLTGGMDRDLGFAGEYVRSFTGYLVVERDAQIYCWERYEDDDGDVRWSKTWMSSVEGNSRNAGIDLRLSSARFVPESYAVGPLEVDSELIDFVDPAQSIEPSSLEITRAELRPEGDYLFLRKGQPDELGDERVRYSGVPVPATATYFGRFEAGRGVADTTQQTTGFINQIIRDTGILHHIVAGERDAALATMKAHITRLKWIVRAAGTGGVVMGFFMFFSAILGVLFHIPLIGRVAESGAFLASLVLGLPLAALTILGSYLIAHPLVSGLATAAVVALGWTLYRRGKSSQRTLLGGLEQRLGRTLDAQDLKELEFLELAGMALADSTADASERDFLKGWAKKQGWDDHRLEAMLAKARQERDAGDRRESTEEHLGNLIRLSMADGRLSPPEMRTIRKAAKDLGYSDATIRGLMRDIRRSA